MELIDEGLFDYSESANELGNLIIKFSKNLKSNQSFESYISYEEFENLIRSFINDVMCYYLKRINVSREVLVLVFDYWFSGAFLETGNGIVIQSEIMESIYKGNIEYLSVVFHELVHFQVYCDINYRKIVNEDTVRILKEKLIRFYVVEHNFNDSYYYGNYQYYSEEVFANNEAINQFVQFFYLVFNSKIKDKKTLYNDMFVLEDSLRENAPDYEELYKNKMRNFKNVGYFNDNVMSFEDAFDYLIKYNPKWLEYSQISSLYECVHGDIRRKEEYRRILCR